MPDKDEAAIEAAFYEEECPYFFSVDWSEDDADIVMYCSDCLNLDSLHAE